jgi:subtilisin family serine protease
VSDPIVVAVIDSGANVPHPHLPSVSRGLAIDLHGNEHDDWIDRLGHGTAVAAAIHEKAPAAELIAIKVFDTTLATSVPTLIRAIDRASELGARLVNLSLGTPNDLHRARLEAVVARAGARGTLIVSAREHDDARWYPGCLEGVVGVVLDWDHPREAVSVEKLADDQAVLRASGYPRPIPGVAPARNLHGISFAVANATGVLARVLGEAPDVRTAAEAVGLVAAEATA